MTEEKRFSSDLGPLHMSPITGFTGSVTGLTGTNFQRPHDKGEIQETKPRLKMVEQHIALGCRSFVGSCTFINKANSRTSKVEIHTRQKLCHFDRYVAKAKLSCLKSLSQERGISHSWRHHDLQITVINRGRGVLPSIRYLIIWLAPRAGKMNQIACCDWLPEQASWSHLARSGLPAVSRMQNFTKSHIINPLLTKFFRSRWLDIGQVLFLRVYGPRRSRGP